MKQRVVIPTKGAAAPPQPVRRVPVLIVLHSDGWVEVLGDNVDVHVAQLLHAETPENEIRAEEYLNLGIPQRFRRLHFPSKRQAVGQCEERTAEDDLKRLLAVQFVRECKNLPEVFAQ